MSPRFARLVQALHKRAEVIIFDGPPMLSMPDVNVLSSQIEHTVLVVSHGSTSRRELREAVNRLKGSEGIHLLGIIFDRVRLRDQSYSYYYYRSQPASPSWIGRVASQLRRIGRSQADISSGDGEEMVGVAQAAEQLGISRAMTRRWIRQGRLPATRIGLNTYVRRVDVDALIEQQISGKESLFLANRDNGGSSHNRSHTDKMTQSGQSERNPNSFMAVVKSTLARLYRRDK
jgi:excisionase family DNA binding protein